MEMVKITMNEKQYRVDAGCTILKAAEDNGIHIPTLCNLKGLDARANCRMCVVEIEGMRTLQPSCATKVREGMVIKTESDLVRRSRRATLELILSSHAVDCHHCLRIGSSKCADLDPVFCEMCFFCDCVKDGFCELQALAREYEVDVLPYEMHPYDFEEDVSLGSVIRNPNKCIKCRRCVDVCGEIQTTHTLSMENRGRQIQVVPGMAGSMKESPCVRCGRCVTVCPTGAVYMKEHKDEVIYYAHHYDYQTAAVLSHNVLGELEDLFHMERGTLPAERVADGLKKIGIDTVADESFALEIAAGEGVCILKKKFAAKHDGRPIILISGYGAENFIDRHFPQLKELVVKYPSMQKAFGDYMRTTYAAEQKIPAERVKIYSVSNDNENGAEAHETGCVDISVNARELYRIFLRTGVDLKRRKGIEPDFVGKRVVPELFMPVSWNMGREPEETEMAFEGCPVKVVTAHNLGQARKVLERMEAGTIKTDIIRIQA